MSELCDRIIQQIDRIGDIQHWAQTTLFVFFDKRRKDVELVTLLGSDLSPARGALRIFPIAAA